MANDLAGLRTQVSALLWDENKNIWKDSQLDQALRSALGAYNLTVTNWGEAAAAVKDLDAAAATTLPAEHEGLLLLGAAGYAAAGRGMDRAEAYDLNEETPAALVKWGDLQLESFRAGLESIAKKLADAAAAVKEAAEDAKEAAAAALQAAKEAAEAARLAELRGSAAAPWGVGRWTLDGRDGETL